MKINNQHIYGGSQQFADNIINNNDNNLNDLDREFIKLIHSNIESEEERIKLLKNLSLIKNDDSSQIEKEESKNILNKFLKVIPGETGKQLVKQLINNGADYLEALL